MAANLFTRRNLAVRVASFVSGLGLAELLSSTVAAGAHGAGTQQTGGVQKLGYEGKPAGGTEMITPLIVHNGLIYIAGQGAHSHDNGETFPHGHREPYAQGHGQRENFGRSGRRHCGQHFATHRVSREHRLLRRHEQSIQNLFPAWRPRANDRGRRGLAGAVTGGNQLHRCGYTQVRNQGAYRCNSNGTAGRS